MSWCVEAASRCIWLNQDDKRNAIASIVAGTLFAIGWWIIIDVAAKYSSELPGGAHVCGILGTVSLLMINSVTNSQVRGDAMYESFMNPRVARLWLFIGFVLGFASLIAACWILFAKSVNTADEKVHSWPGIGLFLQNILILAASLVFKFGRSEELWN